MVTHHKAIESDETEKSLDGDLQKALHTLELAHMAGQIDKETIEKARSQAGVYSNTYQNRKLGQVGQKYKEGDKKQETPQSKESDSTHNFNLKEGQQVRVQGETKFQTTQLALKYLS